MLVLAIDTALAACSAAVLDTEQATSLSSESLPMARGHAEALMPLIERVMIAADVGFSAARGVALAAGKPAVGLTTLSAYAAPLVAEARTEAVLSAIDARHDQVYYQLVMGDGSMLHRPAIAPIDSVLRQMTEHGALRIVGNAAQLLASRWPTEAQPPVEVCVQPAPDITWVAWLGAAAAPDKSPARPLYLRPPDAKPQASTLPQEPAPPS